MGADQAVNDRDSIDPGVGFDFVSEDRNDSLIESQDLSDSSDGNGSLDERGCLDEGDSLDVGDAGDSSRSSDEHGSFDWIDQSDLMMRLIDSDSPVVTDELQIFLLGSMISCCLLRSYFRIQEAQCPDQVRAIPEK